MMQNPLPNNINPKFKRETNPAVVKTLIPRLNVEDELCFFLNSNIDSIHNNVAS